MLSNRGLISQTLTFILAGGNGTRLHPLTKDKAKPLVPFGGVFRIIDFTLSNCVNSNLKSVYLLTQHKQASLHRYVEAVASKPDSPFCDGRGSLMCLHPKPGSTYGGTADAMFQNLSTINQEKPEFVLILASDQIYQMDYTNLLRRHADSGADVTVAAVEYPRKLSGGFGVLQVNARGEVIAFEEKPQNPKPMPTNPNTALVSMGIYVFNTRALIKAVTEDARRTRSNHDFGANVIPDSIGSLRVSAYDFTTAPNSMPRYWRDVGTLDTYYRSQMELLVVNSPFDPYNDALWPEYAFGELCPSSSLAELIDRHSAADSVVSRSSTISGARIVRSVISRGVHVEPSAEIESSVLLPGVRVGRGARIQQAVIDENVQIPEGTTIGYDREADRHRFRVSAGGVVIVSGETVMPREEPLRLANSSGVGGALLAS
jgi:glucose-1-phosphate adenylyltransferase